MVIIMGCEQSYIRISKFTIFIRPVERKMRKWLKLESLSYTQSRKLQCKKLRKLRRSSQIKRCLKQQCSTKTELSSKKRSQKLKKKLSLKNQQYWAFFCYQQFSKKINAETSRKSPNRQICIDIFFLAEVRLYLSCRATKIDPILTIKTQLRVVPL